MSDCRLAGWSDGLNDKPTNRLSDYQTFLEPVLQFFQHFIEFHVRSNSGNY